MISFAQPVPIGNAVKIVIAPGSGAKRWRVLRKATNNISDENDPAALAIYEGGDDILVMDTGQLQNGTEYFYAEYEFNGTAWAKAGDTVGVTPATAYTFAGADVLTIVRERVKLGIAAAVAANALKPQQAIEVLTAPPLYENIKWPMVSVHVNQDASEVRGIGEMVGPDEKDFETGNWQESEGWLSRWRIQVIGWSLNPDERISLRKVIKAVMIGNLPVFDAAGMVQIDFSQTDAEDFNSYNAPVYQVIGDFSCLAVSSLDDEQDSVSDVTVDVDADQAPVETP